MDHGDVVNEVNSHKDIHVEWSADDIEDKDDDRPRTSSKDDASYRTHNLRCSSHGGGRSYDCHRRHHYPADAGDAGEGPCCRVVGDDNNGECNQRLTTTGGHTTNGGCDSTTRSSAAAITKLNTIKNAQQTDAAIPTGTDTWSGNVTTHTKRITKDGNEFDSSPAATTAPGVEGRPTASKRTKVVKKKKKKKSGEPWETLLTNYRVTSQTTVKSPCLHNSERVTYLLRRLIVEHNV
eukprot:Lankesteria_metandrocarpae@DN477_c0_g1_i1.p1